MYSGREIEILEVSNKSLRNEVDAQNRTIGCLMIIIASFVAISSGLLVSLWVAIK